MPDHRTSSAVHIHVLFIYKQADFELTIVGQHGYDNKEDDMKTTLIASGPHFKSGYKQASMNSVDLYPLMCRILGLRTCHRSSGCLKNTRNLVDWWAVREDRRTKLRFLNRH